MNIFDGIDVNQLSKEKWKLMTNEEKLSILARIEENVAKIKGRKARDLNYIPNLSKGTEAEYVFNNPDVINFYNLNDIYKCVESVIHEGTHALIDDVSNGIIETVNLYSSLKSDDLTHAIQLRDILYNHLYQKHEIVLFQLKYVEEQLARFESYVTILESVFSSNQMSPPMKKEWFEKICVSAINYYMYCNTIESQLGTYETEIADIDIGPFKDRIRKISEFNITQLDASTTISTIENVLRQYLGSNFNFDVSTAESILDIPENIQGSQETETPLIQRSIEKFQTLLMAVGQRLDHNSSSQVIVEQQSEFIKRLIWSYTFGEKDATNLVIMSVIYPKYKQLIDRNPSSDIYKCFHGEAPYRSSANIIENLNILMNSLSETQLIYPDSSRMIPGESKDDGIETLEGITEKKLAKILIQEYHKQEENFKKFAAIIILITTMTEFDSKTKKVFKKEYGIDSQGLRKLFRLKKEYFGGLGEYEERWEKIKHYFFPRGGSTPDEALQQLLEDPQSCMFLQGLGKMLQERSQNSGNGLLALLDGSNSGDTLGD